MVVRKRNLDRRTMLDDGRWRLLILMCGVSYLRALGK